MEAMGFDGQTPDRLRDYTFLDVTTTWVKELKDAHVTGMNAQNLMGLRALQVDAAYVRAMAADGYPELAADKLTSVRAFIGYSGWSKQQLETELAQKAWIIRKPDMDALEIDQCKQLWPSIMRELGPWFRLLASTPDDPSRN